MSKERSPSQPGERQLQSVLVLRKLTPQSQTHCADDGLPGGADLPVQTVLATTFKAGRKNRPEKRTSLNAGVV